MSVSGESGVFELGPGPERRPTIAGSAGADSRLPAGGRPGCRLHPVADRRHVDHLLVVQFYRLLLIEGLDPANALHVAQGFLRIDRGTGRPCRLARAPLPGLGRNRRGCLRRCQVLPVEPGRAPVRGSGLLGGVRVQRGVATRNLVVGRPRRWLSGPPCSARSRRRLRPAAAPRKTTCITSTSRSQTTGRFFDEDR